MRSSPRGLSAGAGLMIVIIGCRTTCSLRARLIRCLVAERAHVDLHTIIMSDAIDGSVRSASSWGSPGFRR
jgi:hypothetical protein